MPSVFVRASGCNLRCWFCDTPYASWQPEGEDLSVGEIVRRARRAIDAAPRAEPGAEPVVASHAQPVAPLPAPQASPLPLGSGPHAVLTGGEPMLFADLVPLTDRLRKLGFHITIETAGTLYLPVACDLMSISPKLSNSTPPAARGARWRRRHEQSRHAPEVIRRLLAEYPYQLKFVIDGPADCDEVAAYLGEFPEIDRNRVLLMPQGIDAALLAARAAWLEPICRQRGWRSARAGKSNGMATRGAPDAPRRRVFASQSSTAPQLARFAAPNNRHRLQNRKKTPLRHNRQPTPIVRQTGLPGEGARGAEKRNAFRPPGLRDGAMVPCGRKTRSARPLGKPPANRQIGKESEPPVRSVAAANDRRRATNEHVVVTPRRIGSC